MGIYDREYYRRDGPSFLASLADSGKVCKWLIAINVALFVLQMVTKPALPIDFDTGRFSFGPVTDALDLDTTKVLHGQVWRLVTSAFLHANFMHIFFNMLFLWWFGHEVENIYGPREFLAFYLLAALMSGLAYVGWQIIDNGSGAALGASGAVTAVMVLFAMHYPNHRILMFMVLPVSVWLFVVFMVGKDLFTFFNERNPQIAVTAHLGGAAFGFLYYKMQWRVLNWIPDLSLRRRTAARPRLRIYQDAEVSAEPIAAPTAPAIPDVDEHLEAQVDAVLAKMNRTGKESLTDAEREILIRASELYKRRRT